MAFDLPGAGVLSGYALLLAIAGAFGLALAAWNSPPDWERIVLESGALSLFCALFGARADYILRNWEFYQDNLAEAINPATGGLAWPGAVLGVFLSLGVYSWWAQVSPARLADSLVPLLVAVSVAAWLGCWLAACDNGLQSAGWGSPVGDDVGQATERYSLQLIGALMSLVLSGLGEWLAGRITSGSKRLHGVAASLAVTGIMLVLFLLSFWKTDPPILWLGWRLETWAAVSCSTLALFTLVILISLGKTDET